MRHILPLLFIIIVTSVKGQEILRLDTEIEPHKPTFEFEGYSEFRDLMEWETFSTSNLTAQLNNNYEAINLTDGNSGTAWIEGKQDYGIDESFSFIFKNVYGINKAEISSITVLNGYSKSDKTWKENSRVKAFSVYLNNKQLFNLFLSDTINIQYLDLKKLNREIEVNANDTLKFKIKEIFAGDRFKDTAITEIELGRSY